MTIRYVLIVILIAMVAILGAIALNGIFEAWETGQIEIGARPAQHLGYRTQGSSSRTTLARSTGPFFLQRTRP